MESRAPPDLSQNQHFRSWKHCARGSLETEACASERAGAQSGGASCLCPGTDTLVRYCLPSMSVLPLSDHITFPEAPQTGVCASCPGTCSSLVSFTLRVQLVLS